jgi:5-methylcytosine-specific restriction enzyme A
MPQRFIKGHVYNRRQDLHKKYGGNRQSGITPCANHPLIFLFTSPIGKEYGYNDHWISQDIFSYTGEGQYGDMELSHGNLAIKNHKNDGRELHLFERTEPGYYKYLGELEYLSHEIRKGVDTDHLNRNLIVFQLKRRTE